jgi:predicted amidohydrolase
MAWVGVILAGAIRGGDEAFPLPTTQKGPHMKHFCIGLVQMRCEKGAVAENLASTARYINEATHREVDVLGFPEASLSGYVDPARYPEAVLSLDGSAVAQALALTRGYRLTALMGIIEARPGHKPYVTQLVARDGELLGVYRKQRVVEEDAEWYSAGDGGPVFAHGDWTCGIAICADIAHEPAFAGAAAQGAQIVFELAAPGLYGDMATRDWNSGFRWWEGECQQYLARWAQRYGIWVAVASQAGRTVDEDFPGGGYVFAPDGRRLYATPDGGEGAVYLELGEEEGEYFCRET